MSYARMTHAGNEEPVEPNLKECVRPTAKRDVEAERLRRQWDEELRQLFAQNESHRSEIRRRHEEKVKTNLVVAEWRHVLDRRERRKRFNAAMAMVLVLPFAGAFVGFLSVGDLYAAIYCSLPILPVVVYFQLRRSDS